MSRPGTLDADGNFILDDDMPQEKWCPAGKIECGMFRSAQDDIGLHPYCLVSGEPIFGWDSCPHTPQMEPLNPEKKNYLREQYISWFAAGRVHQSGKDERAVTQEIDRQVNTGRYNDTDSCLIAALREAAKGE